MIVRRHLQRSDDAPPDTGDEAWLLICAAMVFLMTPALAMFYGGMVSPRAVVHTMMLSFVSMSVGAVVWSVVGYSLAFGPAGATNILGDLAFGFFDSSDRLRSADWPVSEHAYFGFQLAFNTITIAVISGGVVERIRLWAFVVFSVFWTLIVYVPLARWIFYPDGWLAAWGVLDFAGGLVVETNSGVSAFVLAYWLGPGQTLHGGSGHTAPHSIPLVLLGAGLLWFGWFGFNAGSAIVSGYIAGRAFVNTHLCASAAMAVWGMCEVVWGGDRLFSGSATALGAATGAVAGLVAITPACGYVSQMVAILIGVLCGVACYWAARVMKRSGVDDRLECLPVHGCAGATGILLTGLFARTAEDAPADGALYGNAALLGKQAVALIVTVAMAVVGTSVSYALVECVARLVRVPLRVDADAQHRVDAATHGESAYHHLHDAEAYAGAHDAVHGSADVDEAETPVTQKFTAGVAALFESDAYVDAPRADASVSLNGGVSPRADVRTSTSSGTAAAAAPAGARAPLLAPAAQTPPTVIPVPRTT